MLQDSPFKLSAFPGTLVVVRNTLNLGMARVALGGHWSRSWRVLHVHVFSCRKLSKSLVWPWSSSFHLSQAFVMTPTSAMDVEPWCWPRRTKSHGLTMRKPAVEKKRTKKAAATLGEKKSGRVFAQLVLKMFVYVCLCEHSFNLGWDLYHRLAAHCKPLWALLAASKYAPFSVRKPRT